LISTAVQKKMGALLYVKSMPELASSGEM